MTKIHTTISLDPILIEEAKKLKINVSEICNFALNSTLNLRKSSDFDIEITKKELEIKQKDMVLLSTEIQSLQEKVRLSEQSRKEYELNFLKQQAESEKKKTHCYFCNFPILEGKALPISNGAKTHMECWRANDKKRAKENLRLDI